MEYRIKEDLVLVQELMGLSRREFAQRLNISQMTLERWLSGVSFPSSKSVAAFYNFAFSAGVPLNQIKAQLYREEASKSRAVVLFHGSKSGIEGPLSIEPSRANNDFGKGFYCGESLEQSAMFVNNFPRSSIYVVSFDPAGLESVEFTVEQDWTLAVGAFRGRLGVYGNHPRIREIVSRVKESDYIVAPIADNQMFEILDDFCEGLITDEQCQHCLSATSLGRQYVLVTEAALRRAALLERCFLCSEERARYQQVRTEQMRVGLTKVKAARRLYRTQGSYIDEILAEVCHEGD